MFYVIPQFGLSEQLKRLQLGRVISSERLVGCIAFVDLLLFFAAFERSMSSLPGTDVLFASLHFQAS